MKNFEGESPKTLIFKISRLTRLKEIALFLLFLVVFSPDLLAVTRTELYLSIQSRRRTYGAELAALKTLQDEIKELQTKINADPFDEASRATFAQKVAEGKSRSSALQGQIDGFNNYLKFIAPAFKTQGTGWANLFFRGVIPNFNTGEAAPSNTVNTEFQNASQTFPIPAFPTPPTLTVTPSRTSCVYGEQINFTATATGSGTITFQWSTNQGALSAADGPTVTLTAPSGTDGKEIVATVVCVAKNKKDSDTKPTEIRCGPGGVPTCVLGTIPPQVVFSSSVPLSATATGSGTLTIEWTVAPSGTISPSSAPANQAVNLMVPAPAAQPIQLTITAKTKSSFGLESAVVTGMTLATTTASLNFGGAAPLGQGESGSIGGDLTGGN